MPDATYDNQNTFARVLRGELPCVKVYKGDHIIAFMDIMSQTDGHVLVLPKKGAAKLFDLSDDAASAATRTTRKSARTVRAVFTPPGITIFQLSGSTTGQTVPYVHFHVLSRYSDTPLQPHTHVQADSDKLEAQAEKIITALQAE